MLSRLVFHDWPPHVDWSDHEFPASLNIADLACGTGTLLMAVAAEAERRHTDAGGRNAPELHKAMVEQALHGYDVQLSAVHFAATSLAMLNPDIQFDRMNLYVMPLGVEGSNVNLGSLDFLGQDEAPVQYALSEEEMGVGARDPERSVRRRLSRCGGGRDRQAAGAGPGDYESPVHPYWGESLFGMLPEADRRKLQRGAIATPKRRGKRQSELLDSPRPSSQRQHPSCGPARVDLPWCCPPQYAPGSSWKQTRSLIERDFVLDIVITSTTRCAGTSLDSTDLSEVLLIANETHARVKTRLRGAQPSLTCGTTRTVCWMPTGSLRQSLLRCRRRLEEYGMALLRGRWKAHRRSTVDARDLRSRAKSGPACSSPAPT